MSRYVIHLVAVVAVSGWIMFPAAARAQSLGRRVPGTLGIHAGDQPGAGLYVAGQFVRYASSVAVDRDGNASPIDLDAVAGAFGVAASFQLPDGGPYLGAAIGLPAGHVSLETDSQARIDRGGTGDLYIQALRLGAKLPYADLSASYGVYFPTGRYDARGQDGFGNGQFTHELAAGGTLFFDAEHTVFVSAVGSVFLNGPKRTIDLTRGSTVQVQGGIGVRLFHQLDLGVAGYALWQVTDDEGTALPPALRGAREQVYGIGPEIDVVIPEIGAQFTARYGHDFGVRSRPEGGLFFVGLAWRVWDFGAARRRESAEVSGTGTGLAF
jgi:hypothetical protein